MTLFGQRYASPFGIAPMGIAALSAYRGDIVLARAAAAAGIPAVQSGSSLIRLEEVMAPLAAQAQVLAATRERLANGTATAPQRTLARYIGGLR